LKLADVVVAGVPMQEFDSAVESLEMRYFAYVTVVVEHVAMVLYCAGAAVGAAVAAVGAAVWCTSTSTGVLPPNSMHTPIGTRYARPGSDVGVEHVVDVV
tara:strand:+ start:456 stop:755 length:300 start_codon:yes stop_codon:yes gene_type:complete